ncbi:hypothetical protein V6N12_009667 [Hibiscus sabdariffa]|uniref:Uncharacterized protein n=1 Tax=Hibiscus sabdariffa TaxID=183260 RepID=A0ABR2BUS9_9ROSI
MGLCNPESGDFKPGAVVACARDDGFMDTEGDKQSHEVHDVMEKHDSPTVSRLFRGRWQCLKGLPKNHRMLLWLLRGPSCMVTQ